MKNRILIVEDDRAISDAVALNMQFVGLMTAKRRRPVLLPTMPLTLRF